MHEVSRRLFLTASALAGAALAVSAAGLFFEQKVAVVDPKPAPT